MAVNNERIDLKYVNRLVYPDHFQSRQWDVLKLKLLGYTNREAAATLGIGEETTRTRWQEIREILNLSGLGGRKELMQWAIENHLIKVHF